MVMMMVLLCDKDLVRSLYREVGVSWVRCVGIASVRSGIGGEEGAEEACFAYVIVACSIGMSC